MPRWNECSRAERDLARDALMQLDMGVMSRGKLLRDHGLWVTADKEVIPIKMMEDSHLNNCINVMIRLSRPVELKILQEEAQRRLDEPSSPRKPKKYRNFYKGYI